MQRRVGYARRSPPADVTFPAPDSAVPEFLKPLLESSPDRVLPGLLSWLGLAVLTSLLAALIVRALHRWGWRLLPPWRRRAIPWTGLHVFGVVGAYILLPAFVGQALLNSGLLGQIYGPDFAAQLHRGTDQLDDLTRTRMVLWGMTASLPFQLAAVILIVRSGTSAQPYQLGLTTYRLKESIALGFLTWLIVSPLVLILNRRA
jgi:hypothetical protein